MVVSDTFFTERKFSHLHYKTKGYGFNWWLLNRSSFNWIMLQLEDGTSYKLPKQTILSFGTVLYFKNASDGNSFELQIFLPFDIIKNYKINNNNNQN
jgi:hypothetical protein